MYFSGGGKVYKLYWEEALSSVDRSPPAGATAVLSICQEARGSSNLLTLRPNMPERSSTQASPQGSSAHFISLEKKSINLGKMIGNL